MKGAEMTQGARSPAKLAVLYGKSPGKDSGGRNLKTPPAFKRGAPRPPTWLTTEAKAEWRRVVPILTELELLKPEDRAMLSAYCEMWSLFVAASRLVQQDGLTYEIQGRLHANPAVSMAAAAARDLKTLANQFGLSPSAEMVLAVEGKKDASLEDNPFGA